MNHIYGLVIAAVGIYFLRMPKANLRDNAVRKADQISRIFNAQGKDVYQKLINNQQALLKFLAPLLIVLGLLMLFGVLG